MIAHGGSLVKTHDLVFLIGEIRQRGQEIGWFDKSAALLSKEFFEERYVSWDAEPTPSAEELTTIKEEVERLFAVLDVR